MSDIRQVRTVAVPALVIAALALLLLRPFCGLALAASDQVHSAPAAITAGHGVAGHAAPAAPPSEACCASVSEGVLVNLAEPLVPRLPDAPLVAAFLVLAGLPLFANSRNRLRFRLAAPPERPFYARSARILR